MHIKHLYTHSRLSWEVCALLPLSPIHSQVPFHHSGPRPLFASASSSSMPGRIAKLHTCGSSVQTMKYCQRRVKPGQGTRPCVACTCYQQACFQGPSLTHTLEKVLHCPVHRGDHLCKGQAQVYPVESSCPWGVSDLWAWLWDSKALVACDEIHPMSYGCPCWGHLQNKTELPGHKWEGQHLASPQRPAGCVSDFECYQ